MGTTPVCVSVQQEGAEGECGPCWSCHQGLSASPKDRALELGWPPKLPHGGKAAGPRCPCVYEESWVAAYSQTGCNPRARQYSSAKGSLGEALKCESQHPLFPASGRVSPWVPKQVSSTLIQQCVFQSIIVVTEY